MNASKIATHESKYFVAVLWNHGGWGRIDRIVTHEKQKKEKTNRGWYVLSFLVGTTLNVDLPILFQIERTVGQSSSYFLTSFSLLRIDLLGCSHPPNMQIGSG